MRVRLVLGVIGNVLRVFSIAFLAPILMAAYEGDWDVAGAFAFALWVSAGLGWVFGRWFEKTRFLRMDLGRL